MRPARSSARISSMESKAVMGSVLPERPKRRL